MRIGLALGNTTFSSLEIPFHHKLLLLVKQLEEAGFDSLWVWDHFFNDGEPVGPGTTDRAMLEAFTTLGFIAGATKTIRFGTMVAGVTHRHPGILIKQVTSLDVLSGGRVSFGIGAAWFEEEHVGLGVPFPSVRERFEMLEETIQIALQMWADGGKYEDAKEFRSKHYHLKRTLNVPQSVQRPHPPILIGGNGEKKTLAMVARYGDACNFVGRLSKDELEHKLEILRLHCEKQGRAFSSIEKTFYDYSVNITGGGHEGTMTVEQALEYFQSLAQLGIDTLIVDNVYMDFSESEYLEFWSSEVLPRLKAL